MIFKKLFHKYLYILIFPITIIILYYFIDAENRISNENIDFSNIDIQLNNPNPLKKNGYNLCQLMSDSIPMVIVLCRNNEKDDTIDGRSSWTRQQEQLRTMFGSLLMFSKCNIWNILVLSDIEDIYHLLENLIKDWPNKEKSRLNFKFKSLNMPNNLRETLNQWRPCVWVKQFLATLLPELDKVVYIDTDILFLGPAEDLWKQFHLMTDKMIYALGPEPWYIADNIKHPFAGEVGLNTGILIYNLAAARKLPRKDIGYHLIKQLTPGTIIRHDQDAVNMVLENDPKYFLELSARFNFVPASCYPFASNCAECEKDGILALHGADATFYRPGFDSKFQYMYKKMLNVTKNMDYNFHTLYEEALSSLKLIDKGPTHICSYTPNFSEMLTKKLKEAAEG